MVPKLLDPDTSGNANIRKQTTQVVKDTIASMTAEQQKWQDKVEDRLEELSSKTSSI